MLRVKFAEVSKQAEKRRWASTSAGMTELRFTAATSARIRWGSSPASPGPPPAPNLLAIPSGALERREHVRHWFVREASRSHISSTPWKQNSLLRTLAEPNLVTTSGQKATFLAGGSFPYPVPQSGTGGGSTVTIQFQPYGVQSDFHAGRSWQRSNPPGCQSRRQRTGLQPHRYSGRNHRPGPDGPQRAYDC